MAISTYTNYKSFCEAPNQQIQIVQQGVSLNQGRLFSLWGNAPGSGATPTTAAVPAQNIQGAIGQLDGAGYLCFPDFKYLSGINTGGGIMVLCDRLSHQGGLDGTLNTAQTTNLPTAALTRYTTGAGVWAGIEIYSQVGTTATTFTASYTNQAGTAGQISQPVAIGASPNNSAFRFFPFNLAAGDSGVRAVASVTLAATTGTAGNFGVTLFKPLMAFPLKADISPSHFVSAIQGGCQSPQILNGACLFWLCINSSGTFGLFQGVANLVDA